MSNTCKSATETKETEIEILKKQQEETKDDLAEVNKKVLELEDRLDCIYTKGY